MLKKIFVITIILCLSLILTTSTPFQHNNLFQDNLTTNVNHNIQSVYAQEDDDDNDDDNGNRDDDDDDNGNRDDDDDDDDDDDNGGDNDEENVNKVSIDDSNVPVSNAVNSPDDSLLSFNSPISISANETVKEKISSNPSQPDSQLVSNPLTPNPPQPDSQLVGNLSPSKDAEDFKNKV